MFDLRTTVVTAAMSMLEVEFVPARKSKLKLKVWAPPTLPKDFVPVHRWKKPHSQPVKPEKPEIRETAKASRWGDQTEAPGSSRLGYYVYFL